MSERDPQCQHQWIDTQQREGDAFRCLRCGKGVSCTCALHFNAWSSVHSRSCALWRRDVKV